ncbi:hypothetical protein AB3N59_14230 [Leptospira sp. WS92.C1]
MFQKIIRRIFSKEEFIIPPLQFSPKAVDVIQRHLERRTQSSFQVRIDRKPNSINVQVGYDKKKNIIMRHSYPVLVEMSQDDEICLEGSRIEWNRESQEFQIYPDVDLDIEYKPISNCFRLEVNRFVFKEGHSRTYQTETDFPEWFPKEIRSSDFYKVEIQGRIWVLFLTRRMESKEILEIENRIADAILDFFSGFPRRCD